MSPTTAGKGGRLLGLAAMIFSVLLLASTGVYAHQQHSRAVEQLDRSLTVAAEDQASSLRGYLERARSIVLVTANNPVFAQFYEEPGSRTEKIERGGPLLEQVNQALVYLTALYPHSIGEACFIDRGGAEIARSVDGVPAPVDELSPDETGNPFFYPSFDLPIGVVHHAIPYVSPDTGEWVIANATPIPMADGIKRAIVHFEVTIESFRSTAAVPDQSLSVQVVDAKNGYVVLDSRFPQRIGAPLGRPRDRRFVPIVQQGDPTGIREAGGIRMAIGSLPRSTGNANDWYVVASAASLGGFGGRIDPSLSILMGLALIVFLFGVFVLRSSMRAERARMDDLNRDLERRRTAEEALRTALQREQEAAESLRTLDEMKNGFLRAVSHELRTPLTSVMGYALTLQRMEEGAISLDPGERMDMLHRLASTRGSWTGSSQTCSTWTGWAAVSWRSNLHRPTSERSPASSWTTWRSRPTTSPSRQAWS